MLESSDIIKKLNLRSKVEPIAKFLDMNLVELSPGYAKVTMLIKPEYQNFNNLSFGGIIMAIADQAFAYASNSSSFPSIASQFNIHFVSGANINDELTAECWVIRSGRRAGISEIKVTNQSNKLIAKATGTTIPVSQNK
jgi:acyl-CoA thioesterase